MNKPSDYLEAVWTSLPALEQFPSSSREQGRSRNNPDPEDCAPPVLPTEKDARGGRLAWSERLEGASARRFRGGTSRALSPRRCHGLVLALGLAGFLTLTSTQPLAAQCVGDCDDGGDVTINEIITMVNVLLENAELARCAAGDANDDGQITVNEIIAAVNHALCGCGMTCPTPVPTATGRPTATPTRTLPALDEVVLTDRQIEVAVEAALEGLADPWGTDFRTVIERIFDQLGVRLDLPAAVRMSQGQAAGDRDCLRDYCSDADYYGYPSNSVTVPYFNGFPPAFYFPYVDDCMNRACFMHDLTSFEQCISGSRDPFGAPTGRPDCYFSRQSAAVDRPFFEQFERCPQTNGNRILRDSVEGLLRIRQLCSVLHIPACISEACDGPPCPGGSCEKETGTCTSCGNGRIDPGEQCDPPASRGGSLDCNDRCQEAVCGDGVADASEECDAGDVHGFDCEDFGFRSGTLRCTGGCQLDFGGCPRDPQAQCSGPPGFAICAATLLLQGVLVPTENFDECFPLPLATAIPVTINDFTIPCFDGEVPCTSVCNTTSAAFFPGPIFGGFLDRQRACLTGFTELPNLFMLFEGSVSGTTATGTVLQAATLDEPDCEYVGTAVVRRFPRSLPLPR